MSRLFGMHAVGDVLAASPRAIARIVHAPHPDPETARLLERATQAGVPIALASHDELRARSGGRGGVAIAADLRSPPALDLDRLEPQGILVALDRVTDPHNLGAILRSAAAFGVRAVIVPRDHAAPLNDAAVRASAGASAVVPIARVTNLARTLGDLYERGFWPCALTAAERDARPIWLTDLASVPVVFVLGAEGGGLRPLVRRACPWAVTIPTEGGIQSLNVSVATAIVLAEATRQRALAAASQAAPGRVEAP